MKIERLERHWPGAESAIDFGPKLNIVLVDDKDQVPGVFDATIAALAGPQKRPGPLRKVRPTAVDELGLSLTVSRCDGHRIRVQRELAGRPGSFRMFDADSGEPILALDREGRSDLLSDIGRDRFESLVRVRQGDIWSASTMGMGVEQVFRRNAIAAGVSVSRETAMGRAMSIIAAESAISDAAPSPLTWARAREVDLGRRIDEARRSHAEAASARAALRRSREALADAERRAEESLYFSLIARQSFLVSKVAKLRSLDEEIRRLTPAPLAHGAFQALEIASQVERLIERIDHFEQRARLLIAEVPEPDGEIRQLEARLNELESALERNEDDSPIATREIDPVIRRAYEDWRRLCAEAEAAEFAARIARQDAGAFSEPSPGVARLARVTTADRLRARLAARTAAMRAREAAERMKLAVVEKIAEAGLSTGELLEVTKVARTPITLLASVEDAHQQRIGAEERVAALPVWKVFEIRRARSERTLAQRNEAARLTLVGYREYDKFADDLEKGFALLSLASELGSATARLAGAAAELRRADDEVSRHASGAAAEQAAQLLGDLERHQNEIAAAEEVREEAQLAMMTAASLRASREAAANELTARVRPFGIGESDPARAWSIYKLAVARRNEHERLVAEISSITDQLAGHRGALDEVLGARDGARRARSQLKQLLARIPDCGSGSIDERLGNFTRLRDEALLEQKLEGARRQVREEYEKALDGGSLADWEGRLVAAESKLSQLEEENPDWTDIEVTGSPELLERAADEAAENLRRVAAEVATSQQRVDETTRQLADLNGLSEELAEVRHEISRLERLASRLHTGASADPAKEMTSTGRPAGADASGSGRGQVEGRPWRGTPMRRDDGLPSRTGTNVASTKTAGSAAETPPAEPGAESRSQYSGTAVLAIDPALALDQNSVGPVEQYISARFALLSGWGPAGEHLPLFVEDVFAAAGRGNARRALEVLTDIAAATQVIVVAAADSFSGYAGDARAAGARVITAG